MKKSAALKSVLNFFDISLANSKCCFWSSPTGTKFDLYDKGILHGKDIGSTAKLVTDIILRMMIYRNNSTRPLPQYTVRQAVPPGPSDFNKGQWTDTKQTSASNSQTFSNPNYISTSTPTGTATTVTTYELIANW